MTTIDEEKTEFKFSELSEKAKENALRDYAENGMHHEWWEFTYDDYKEKCEAAGFSNPKFAFSGFWNQGDGASFSCEFNFTGEQALKYLTAADQAAYHVLCAKFRFEGEEAPVLGLIGRINNRDNHYCHENCMSVENDTVSIDEPDAPSAELSGMVSDFADSIGMAPFAAILDDARDIARQLYRDLEEEYFYQTSEEQVAEASEANDWLYDENGDLI